MLSSCEPVSSNLCQLSHMVHYSYQVLTTYDYLINIAKKMHNTPYYIEYSYYLSYV